MKIEDETGTVQKGAPIWKKWNSLVVFDAGLRHFEDWLNLTSVFIIMFLMFFASAEIIGRYIFNSPIPGHVEIVELIMAGVVFFGVAYTERTGGPRIFTSLPGRPSLPYLLAVFFSAFVLLLNSFNTYLR